MLEGWTLRENPARTSWEGETLYLHTDNDPAAFGLYNSSGYVVRKQEKAWIAVVWHSFNRFISFWMAGFS